MTMVLNLIIAGSKKCTESVVKVYQKCSESVVEVYQKV